MAETNHERRTKIVHETVRKTAIDLFQAEGYYERYQYEGFEKNIELVISYLRNLKKMIRDPKE